MIQADPSIYIDFKPEPLDIQGWGNRKFIQSYVLEKRPSKIIEVGTWKGESALNMAESLKRLGHPFQIVCVDTWLGAREFFRKEHTTDRSLRLKNGYPRIYYQFLSNVIHKNCQDCIIPFPQTSLIASRILRNEGFMADLVYVDASHDYEDVCIDLKAYWPLINARGTLLGHDWQQPNVSKAVNQFVKEHGLMLKTFDHEYYEISSFNGTGRKTRRKML